MNLNKRQTLFLETSVGLVLQKCVTQVSAERNKQVSDVLLKILSENNFTLAEVLASVLTASLQTMGDKK